MTAFAMKLFLAGFVVPVTIMFGILYLARQLRLTQESRSRRDADRSPCGDPETQAPGREMDWGNP